MATSWLLFVISFQFDGKKLALCEPYEHNIFFDNIAFSCTYIFNKNVIAGWINLLKKGAGTSTQQKSYIFLIIIFVQGLSFKKGAGVSVRAADKASGASKEGSLNLWWAHSSQNAFTLLGEQRSWWYYIVCVFLKKACRKRKEYKKGLPVSLRMSHLLYVFQRK